MRTENAPRKGNLRFAALVLSLTCIWAGAQEVTITVHADKPGHRISRYLTGACIEDVNHEIYGGLYSQMIFGESFQEPAPSLPPKGFKAFDGKWEVKDGELLGGPGDGPKLVSEMPEFKDGEVSVEVFLTDRKAGNAGIIVRVRNPGKGADTFDGYEVSLDAASQIVRLGRHRHDWQLMKDTACEVPVGKWIPVRVKLDGSVIEVFVNGRSIIRHDDGERALTTGTVGLRPWQREARYRNLVVTQDGVEKRLPFEAAGSELADVSGMWRLVQSGSAKGSASIDKNNPYVGGQCQRICLEGGNGEFGIENQGLNRWGMYFVGGKKYEGILWAKTEKAVEIFVALESADGTRTHGEQRLKLKAGDWRKLEFKLTPKATEQKGRFTIKLKQPGTVWLGYAFLQPGEWGRFKGLPVRRDVAEGLVDQGITVLRYGGSMVNCAEYRWKKMIGPRDRRPPYKGMWYPHSSNGWGILDFIEFCEAAGFECIPAIYMGESPQDMADFVEYVNGPATSPWGSKRVANGHPAPYRLKYMELGNEERVDDKYFNLFKPMAEAIWAKDPEMIIVVGDFVYTKPIRDPFNFTGSVVGLTNLAAQQAILKLAKEHNREVWFDLHVGTDGPEPDSTFDGMLSFVDALDKIADGAKHRVVVFEFNAGNHRQHRALANALAINAIERDGRIPIATSANCLQPDGQNDNGWDQGLLFLNPSQVWLQPPGWVTRMFSRNYQPVHVPAEVSGGAQLDVSAKRSEDGKTLVLQVVNPEGRAVTVEMKLEGFRPVKAMAQVEELAGDLRAVNTAAEPKRITTKTSEWRHGIVNGVGRRVLEGNSVTVVRLE